MTVTAATEIGTRTQIVLDTSALVADPTVMHAYPGSDVVVPLTVIEELDAFKRHEDRGRSARAALRSIERIRTGGDPTVPIELPDGGTLRIELNGVHTGQLARHGLNPNVADNRIIAAALGQQDRCRDVQVVLVSNDAGLRIKAASLGLDAKEQTGATRPTSNAAARIPSTRDRWCRTCFTRPGTSAMTSSPPMVSTTSP